MAPTSLSALIRVSATSAALAVAIAHLHPTPALAQPATRDDCLSDDVGQVLRERIDAGALQAGLATGLALDHVNVAPDRIVVGMRDARGVVHEADLTLRGRRSGTPDGAGREFEFFLREGAVDPEVRAALLTVARRVDASIPRRVIARCRPPAAPRSWASRGAPLPRAYALSAASAELAILLVALAVAGRRARRPEGVASSATPADSLPLPISLVLFAGAYLAFLREGGSSPIAWFDTAHDESSVLACMRYSSCTTLGQATSVAGLHHEVGWLDLRVLFATLRLDLDQVHGLLLVLDALTVVLVANVARRLGGYATSAFAALSTFHFVLQTAGAQSLYNTAALFFPAAVFLVIGIAARIRADARSIALFALVAGVLASFHAACVIAVVSPLAVALLGPRNRARHVLLVGIVFTITIFAIGPGAWWGAARLVVAKLTSHASRGVGPSADGGPSLLGYASLAIALSAVAIAGRRRLGEGAHVVDAAAAIAVPMLVASAVSAATSTAQTNTKYLAHTVPSLALLAAVPVALVVRAFLASNSPHVRALRDRWVGRAALLPLGASALLALVGHRGAFHRDDMVTLSDVRAVARELRTERGLGWARTYASLKGPHEAEILESLGVLSPRWPLGAPADGRSFVLALAIPEARVPRSLPPGWELANRSEGHALVLVFGDAAIDWRAFDACVGRAGEAPRCERTGLAIRERPSCAYCVPGLDARESHASVESHTLSLVLPLQSASTPRRRSIRMVRTNDVCGGRVARLDAPEAAVSEDGMRATFTSPTRGDAHAEVEIVWDIGSPACDVYSYAGRPPFILEGDEATVRSLERLAMFGHGSR